MPTLSAELNLEAATMRRVSWRLGWIQAGTGCFPLALMPIARVATIGTICALVIGRHQPRTVAATA
jgi:hypothetical protein